MLNINVTKKIIAVALPALIIVIAMIVLFVSKRNKQRDNKSYSTHSSKSDKPITRNYPVMGTWADITLYGDSDAVDEAMTEIYNSFEKINTVCSRFDKNSELSRLNREAADHPFICSDILWDILQKSKFFYELSSETFDVTVTPLMKLWGFYRKQNRIPSDKEIKKVLEIVGFDKIIFNEKDHSVSFKVEGVDIDLGGIAKGYAVDYAFNNIKNPAIKSGLINLGGNIRCFPNPPPDKKYYNIAVRNPFNKNTLLNGSLHLLNKSLATSGDYEQFIMLDGKKFSHIINPKTGYPVNFMNSVTIVTKSALWCDALSTSIFLNGAKFAENIHKQYPNVDILLIESMVDKDSKIKVIKFGNIWKEVSISN